MQDQENVKAAVSENDLKPNDGMVSEAVRGLEWRREFKRGGTPVGVARARDIANRRSLSPSTWKRMYSYFSRHEVDKQGKGFYPDQDGYPSAGRIAWALWGGDPGFSKAKRIVNRLNAKEQTSQESIMPWEIVKDHPDCGTGKYAVVKKDEMQKVHGCHNDRNNAIDQMRALYASENKDSHYNEIDFLHENTMYLAQDIRHMFAVQTIQPGIFPPALSAFVHNTMKSMVEKDIEHMDDSEIYAQNQLNIVQNQHLVDSENLKTEAIFSFSDLKSESEELIELNEQFITLSTNIIEHGHDQSESLLINLVNEYANKLNEIKEQRSENGMQFSRTDYAYVPDPDRPSTWRLRIAERPGKITVQQLNRISTALSNQGLNNKKMEIPEEAVASVKKRIRYEYRRLGISDSRIPQSVKEQDSGFSIFKGSDNKYYWLAVYSNNFRDNDFPSEIISEKSHETFVSLVDQGLVPLPELWHWHTPGTKWGSAQWVDYVSNFAIAFGTVDDGHEKEAEALMNYTGDLGVSHGMPSNLIIRDPENPSVILFHVTHEISDLPWSKAANKHTGFWIKSEDDPMGKTLSAQKRQYMIDAGVDPAKIEDIEKGLAAMSESLKDAVESKESAVEPVQTNADQVAQTNQGIIEMADTVIEIVKPMMESIKEMREIILNLQTEIKALKEEDNNRLVKAAIETPSASLRERMIDGLFGKEAIVAKSNNLVKSGPKETAMPSRSTSGIRFVDFLAVDDDEVE